MADQLFEELQSLITSAEFERLRSYSHAFNPFKALGIETSENRHSNLFAYLFKPEETHGCGDRMLRSFISECWKLVGQTFMGTSEFLSLQFSDVHIHREFECIDILIDFKRSKTVIGIEHKIFAGERASQVSDYQNILSKKFPDYHTRRFIFLTPDGRNTQTAELNNKECACFPISYFVIIKALENGIITATSAVASFLAITKKHLEEDIMEEGEIKNLIHSLWHNKEYSDVLQKIVKYRPLLEDYKQKYLDLFFQNTGLKQSDVEIEDYPARRGSLNEIQISIKKWTLYKLPFRIILYYNPNKSEEKAEKPTVRFVFNEGKGKQKLSDTSITQLMMAHGNEDIFLSQPKTISSAWWQVLKEKWLEYDEHPTLQVNENMAYDAAKLAANYYSKINVRVEQFVESFSTILP